MSTPQLEEKISKGLQHHAKDIGKGLEHVSSEVVKTGMMVADSINNAQNGDLPKAGFETGKAIGSGVIGVTRASFETGFAFGKTAVAALTFPYRRRRSILDYFWKSRRGIITGAADNDPAGVVTYIQTGAAGGYQLLWLVPLAWPLLVAVEEMSARIGLVTRKGINRIIIENFGIFLAWFVTAIVVICNVITIGADIAAMADVTRIFIGLPSIIFTLFFGALFVFIMYKNSFASMSRFLFVITPIFFLYIISAYFLNVDWNLALKETFLPTFSAMGGNLPLLALGFMGTTITPFLIFWETTQEIEHKQATPELLKKERRGVIIGMFFTQFITFFIVVAAAAAFMGHNHLLTTARDAALALKPFGFWAFLLFSLGIIGSGLIAIPVLSSTTAYTFSETMNWSRGLNKSFNHAKGFYWVIFLSIIIGILISISGYNPTLMLFYSQVLNGILMPILLVVLLVISNSKKIMGQYSNRFWSNFLGILAIIINITFIVLLFMGKVKL
jgi:Mn2+/Fe2+ NRAMP family transporter